MQVRKVVEAQLDPRQPLRERDRVLRKVAHELEYQWKRRTVAARCHRETRLRKLWELGVIVSRRPDCAEAFSAL